MRLRVNSLQCTTKKNANRKYNYNYYLYLTIQSWTFIANDSYLCKNLI